jgi:hypothetical protein
MANSRSEPHFDEAADDGAVDESAGAAEPAALLALLSGEAAGGELPPHATSAPTDATAARSATTAIFFMIVFLLQRVPSQVEDAGSYASDAPEPSITRQRGDSDLSDTPAVRERIRPIVLVFCGTFGVDFVSGGLPRCPF